MFKVLPPIKLALLSLLSLLPIHSAQAGWQIVASNIVSSADGQLTNMIVRNVERAVIREDHSTELSILFLLDRQETITLNHSDKVYFRKPFTAAQDSGGLGPIVSNAAKTLFEGREVKAYRWTNGPFQGSLWLDSAEQFLGKTEIPKDAAKEDSLRPNLSVGSLVGESIVIYTEQKTLPLPSGLQGRAESVRGDPDQSSLLQSTLISITQTNLAPSEFEVPSDYQRIAEEDPQSVQVLPELFGSRLDGLKKLEKLKNDFDKGKPVLIPPQVETVNAIPKGKGEPKAKEKP